MKEYILRVVSIGIVTMLSEYLLPRGNIKKYAMFALSTILTLSLICPLDGVEKHRSFSVPTQTENVDYLSESVKSAVNSVKGFENASVKIETDHLKIVSITVKTNNDKMIENTVESIHTDYLKTVLESLYRTENIIIED